MSNVPKSVVGIKIANWSTNSPLSMFADDCLIFGKITKTEIRAIENILVNYEKSIWKLPNLHKSRISPKEMKGVSRVK